MIVLIGRFFAKINEYIHLDTLVECTCSNPSVAMLCNLGGGGKSPVISTFAPFLINEKFLTVMLNLFQQLTNMEVKLLAGETLRPRWEKVAESRMRVDIILPLTHFSKLITFVKKNYPLPQGARDAWRCKSLHFDLGIANTGLEVRCKNA